MPKQHLATKVKAKKFVFKKQTHFTIVYVFNIAAPLT